MAQLVLADAGEGEVLLQERGNADPLGVLLAHQVLIVGEGQQELPDRRLFVHAQALTANWQR